MAEIRETDVARDRDGQVVGTTERVIERRRRGGGFGWGLLFGVLIIAVGIIVFAYSQGGFQQAGVRADSAAASAELNTREAAADASQAIGDAAETTGDALETAGDNAEQAADNAATNVQPN